MIAEPEVNVRAENDNAWKIILKALLKDFMEFFWIDAYHDIDWNRPYELLEQELLAIIDTNNNGKRCIDKLFRVYLKNGQEQWILLHIEIQHSKDENFSERMFVYFYRIYDEYKKDVASIAVLADKDINWRPTKFHRKIWESEITRTYKSVKIMDYKSRENELRNSDNPFAMVVLLQLAAFKTQPDEESRLITKLEFFRKLYKQGWDRDKVFNLCRFLDMILILNPRLELEFINKAKAIDKESGMKLLTSIERYAYKDGVQHGIQHGMQHGEALMLMKLIKYKFIEVPQNYINRINEADAPTLEKWGINVINASSLDEVFKM